MNNTVNPFVSSNNTDNPFVSSNNTVNPFMNAANTGFSKFTNPKDVKPASPSKRPNSNTPSCVPNAPSYVPNIPDHIETTSLIDTSSIKDIFNKKGGMFDSILQDTNNTGEEYESNVKYRTKDEEEDNSGFNFFN